MSRAGDLLTKLLNVFVKLPISSVNFIDVDDLRTTLRAIDESETTPGGCRGFISSGIAWEALLIVNDSSFKDVASLIKCPIKETELTVQIRLHVDATQAGSLRYYYRT
tara:strand:- start:17 stop:340 length:324 start_codon:yes stop_codon:yes gene_type:complete